MSIVFGFRNKYEVIFKKTSFNKKNYKKNQIVIKSDILSGKISLD